MALVGSSSVTSSSYYNHSHSTSNTVLASGYSLPPQCQYVLSSVIPSNAIQILPNRLYWASLSHPPPPHSSSSAASAYYFCVDNHLLYEPFYADFGPLNLARTYRFCKILEKKLSEPALANKRIVYYCSNHPHKRANSAYLICAFQVIVLNYTSDAAYSPFARITPPLLPFRDATYGLCTYPLTLYHCIQGLYYAMQLGWFHYLTFDCDEYEHYEKIENGDINWIIPSKFLAFSGPSDNNDQNNGYSSYAPQDYVNIFKALNIQTIVRLNKKQYDRKRFVQYGFNHVDLYFLDGSCPSREIMSKFLEVCEGVKKGGIAVHCKAGLGRTGSLIGCYAMKHFRFPAAYWIGWNRITRPGSILGPQQHFLNEIQNEVIQMGISEGKINHLPLKCDFDKNDLSEWMGHMTLEEKRQAQSGDAGQGERLVQVKRHHLIEDTEGTMASITAVPSTSKPSLINGSSGVNNNSSNNSSSNSNTFVVASSIRLLTSAVSSTSSKSSNKVRNNNSGSRSASVHSNSSSVSSSGYSTPVGIASSQLYNHYASDTHTAIISSPKKNTNSANKSNGKATNTLSLSNVANRLSRDS